LLIGFVVLNVFQGPSPAAAKSEAVGPWMLKRVQHDGGGAAGLPA
jgi:hypothetical protein